MKKILIIVTVLTIDVFANDVCLARGRGGSRHSGGYSSSHSYDGSGSGDFDTSPQGLLIQGLNTKAAEINAKCPMMVDNEI